VQWSPERFADVIRGRIGARAAQGWSRARIWSWIRTAYDLDRRSTRAAKVAFDGVAGAATEHAGTAPPEPRSDRCEPSTVDLLIAATRTAERSAS
jgi:hypothetical protein